MAARILVVDDDLDTVNLLRMVLQRAGYKVITASSLDEVIDRVKMAEQYREGRLSPEESVHLRLFPEIPAAWRRIVSW